VLVYSDETAQRAVYINGQRYVEGQRVGGQVLVEQILRDGVVLAANGKRFTLRQE
jgi:type II secretory pathway component PulC